MHKSFKVSLRDEKERFIASFTVSVDLDQEIEIEPEYGFHHATIANYTRFGVQHENTDSQLSRAGRFTIIEREKEIQSTEQAFVYVHKTQWETIAHRILAAIACARDYSHCCQIGKEWITTDVSPKLHVDLI